MPEPERRNRRFKVEITLHWDEDELRKEWKCVRDTGTTISLGLKTDYEHVEAVLPTAHSRTVLEAEVDSLDIAEVVAAVFGLDLTQSRRRVAE